MQPQNIHKIFVTLALFLGLSYSQISLGYDIKTGKPKHSFSQNVEYLNKISAGIAELSDYAGKGIVFVSTSKTIKGTPYGQINPFDFFFGPGHRLPTPPGQQAPERKQKGLGSGFFIDLEKGYILTNNHVIDGADEITLKLANGKTYAGKVIGRDKNTDVAVVQIKDKKFNRKGLTALTLGESKGLKVGQFVVALGAPFGLESSLSFGIISATGRGNLNITDLGNFIQTDAAINPGNSGGPLLNSQGQVVGINTAIYSRSGASAGIGFAVPSDLVRNIASQLINKGSVARGYLGVRLAQELDEDLIAALGLPKNTKGALISKVENGTPAAKAGIESGDVITKVNNKPVRSNSDLQNVIGLLAPNTKIPVKLYRDGKEKELNIVLTAFPDDKRVASGPGGGSADDASATAGLKVEKLDKRKHAELIERYRIESEWGLIVVGIDRDSKGFKAGIKVGDVIRKANSVKTRSRKDLVRSLKKEKKVLIHLERQGNYLFAAIRK